MKPVRARRLPTAIAPLSLALCLVLAGLLAGCAGTPAPDWRINAGSALQRMQQALLQGKDRVATNEYRRARDEVAATGRPDLVARVELLRCAAWTASLQFEPCEGFERLRLDAAAPEQAYAAYLRGHLDAGQRHLLPPAQQPLAVAPQGEAAQRAALQATADPLSRLLAAALWLQAGQAAPEVIALAVQTASAQGWRRPLLAWLNLQQQRARQAGDIAEANRIGRRIELVLQGRDG